MQIKISRDAKELGSTAGKKAAESIATAIKARGHANIILATGTSQFETLNTLVHYPGIEWSKANMFHLDEYLGVPSHHPASFRKYLTDRVLNQLPPLASANLISGEGNAEEECSRLGKLITQHPIDVALVGIGENGHLAFNDPPADFDTHQPYIIVSLDLACRLQQLGEGWFGSIEEVPNQAISMSINQIMLATCIICSVPDQRKAVAVKNTVSGPITSTCPASILQRHQDCTLFLDKQAASLLEPKFLTQP